MINNAIKNQQVGGEITILEEDGKQLDNLVFIYDTVTIDPVDVSAEKIVLIVNGDENSVGKSLIINIDGDIFDPEVDFGFYYDGNPIIMADDLADDPPVTETNPPGPTGGNSFIGDFIARFGYFDINEANLYLDFGDITGTLNVDEDPWLQGQTITISGTYTPPAHRTALHKTAAGYPAYTTAPAPAPEAIPQYEP